ncbi:MAG: 3-phosphoshikimate 1-carboxyvinyltransferase [Halanaerobiaceae bacterium]
MKQKVVPVESISGEMDIPGDKSISHRAIIFTSLAEGKSNISGFLECEDCLKTVEAFRSLGVKITKKNSGQFMVEGQGLNGLQEPESVIDCGNSGTTMRLLAGLLATRSFYSVLTGDNSLQQRPMDRVTIPLQQMGARIWSTDDKYAPLGIRGGNLNGIDYLSHVASAQVKSAVLLAGLTASGKTSVTEPEKSRDHSERMLCSMGADVEIDRNKVSLRPLQGVGLKPANIHVPADISSAAFFMAAALLLPDSSLKLKNIGINPTRAGILEVIEKMGGKLLLENRHEISGEPVADIKVSFSELEATVVEGEIIPRLIDEIPVIAVLAALARGKTVIKDASELRVKETDRISALYRGLSRMGADIEEREDGLVIRGKASLEGGVTVDSMGDHRIAMALTVAGCRAEKEILIENSQAVKISFPDFFDRMNKFCR